MRSKPERLDDEERLGAAVVCAIEHGADGETEGHAKFGSRGTSTYRQ